MKINLIKHLAILQARVISYALSVLGIVATMNRQHLKSIFYFHIYFIAIKLKRYIKKIKRMLRIFGVHGYVI